MAICLSIIKFYFFNKCLCILFLSEEIVLEIFERLKAENKAGNGTFFESSFVTLPPLFKARILILLK